VPVYSLYGLVVRSDRELAGLDEASAGAPVDVTLALGSGSHPAPALSAGAVHYMGPLGPDAQPSVEVRRGADEGFWFRYPDGTEFTLDRDATKIGASWADASTLEDTATYLLGPVLGFALRIRGVLALHASAVLIDGRAVALVGPSGAGKSTTAAAFAAAGIPVLADDVLAVRARGDDVLAYPSYRVLRLWGESERILFGTVGQLPRLTPTWDKRALPLGAEFPFHRAPAPLGDVFLFADRSADPSAPRVEPLRSSDAFMDLVANTYANYLLDDRMRAEEMRGLHALLRGRRVRRLVPHADPARLGELVEAVCTAVRGA
jgi:hypothetical protein